MITNQVLAYNLACYYAVTKEREGLLKAVALALSLTLSGEQFLDDSDFDAYHEDQEFLSLLREQKTDAVREYQLFKDYLDITRTDKDTKEAKKILQKE